MVLSIRQPCVSSTDAGCRSLRQFSARPIPSDLAVVPAAVSWVSTVRHSAGNHGREKRLAIIGSRGKEGELCAV